MKKTAQLFVYIGMLFVCSPTSFAVGPYVPIPPSTQGEMLPTVPENLSASSLNQESEVSINTIQKTPGSQEISNGVDKGYNFFEKIRVRAIESVQKEKDKLAAEPTTVSENQSVGTNAGNMHNYFLLFILNIALFILTHKVILYILLIVLLLGVMRVFI